MTEFKLGDLVTLRRSESAKEERWSHPPYKVGEITGGRLVVCDDLGSAWHAEGGAYEFALADRVREDTSANVLAFPDYDHYFRLLTDAQRYKLRINAHKGDLGSVPLDRLMELMTKEMDELREAVVRESEIEIILECADIMNFALGCAISAIRKMNSK